MRQFDDVRPQIAEVASAYDFREPPDFIVSAQQWLATALRWLQNLLDTLRVHLPGGADTKAVGTLMQFALYAAGILGLLIMMAVVVGRIRQTSRARRKRVSGALAETIVDSRGWKAEADRLASAGEWRGSCRALYLSLLRSLDERGITPYAPTKTNYEYWYALARHPAIQMPFRELANRVEVIWFGDKAAGQEDFEYCQQRLVRAEEDIGQHSEARAAI